ncbi:MAG: bifunctional [glutamate--ammonia ligase]-adenylyl-L-tyrosine phosphorylase/[glutamate--ammonia-ligase] adenylyltransferase [Proteobacteria bacterium]|nr:bifunctional [glutamate--ammonia ligase]-adenylyl-L-tyrosine phosphorylase/[glutamate--ammonia-ligase] adenylyltransferase [Pseudomonadota bacterium]
MTSVFELPEELERDALKRQEDFVHALKEKKIRIPENLMPHGEILKTFALSDFIARICINHPELLDDLLKTGDLKRPYIEGEYDGRVHAVIKGSKNDEMLGKALRRLRQREMMRIAWRDLGEYSDLSETMRELSAFADACVLHSVNRLYKWSVEKSGVPKGPDGADQKFIVVAMGKLGACELNFSSDIDLIFLYPDAGFTETPLPKKKGNAQSPVTNEAFFTDLARRVLKIFSENSEDGILFRVDLRLRPYGNSGPIVMSLGSFEDYLLIQGREWERYAFIKARMITGDPKDQKRLADILKSFVYRRYFDYASFDSLREMKQNIVNEVKRKGLKNNIKLGAGGIREIEFFGQIFQLIRGGVEPALRKQEIVEILRILARKEHIPQNVKDELINAYIFLRYTEHRLQEYADGQTHDLPANHKDRVRLAFSMGFDSWPFFEHNLKKHMNHVRHHFSQLLVGTEKDAAADSDDNLLKNVWLNISTGEQAMADLKKAGFGDAGDIIRMLDYLRNDVNTRSLSRGGRDRLNKLMPAILKKIKSQSDACLILTRIVDLIKTIERRTCYIALLVENPSAMDHLIRLASESPWIISYLSRHPVLLDELLDTRTLHVPRERKTMEKELAERMSKYPMEDLEYQIEEMCVFKQVNVLRVAVSDISGAFPLMKVSDYLTDIAESILSKVMTLYFQDLVRKYGKPGFSPGNDKYDTGFAIIGFGKLGGIELGYASDLDLVFLHAAEKGSTSGRQAMDNTQFFYRLGQKIIHALTARTSTGVLYDVDMRLRPSGSAGVIVSHIDSFAEYYRDSAWTFEHQALVRARPICGDKALFALFDAMRKEILCKKRDPGKLKEEIRSMRERMRQTHKPSGGDWFDLKQDKGGIVDIEFLVQYLVLLKASEFEEIATWTDNVRLLQVMAEKGVIENETEAVLKKAYLEYRSRVHKMNLQEKESRVFAKEFQQLREKVIALWDDYIES